MFLTNLNPIMPVQIALSPNQQKAIKISLCNSIMGAITCYLVDPLKKEISRVRMKKSTRSWQYYFSMADLQPGDYWIIIEQGKKVAMQKLQIP